MIRTRDFILFLLTVIFLLLAITVTVWQSGTSVVPVQYNDLSVDVSTATYTAEVVAVADTRAERLAALRQKLREFGGVLTAPEPAVETVIDTDATVVATTSEEVPVSVAIDRCATEQVKIIPGLTGMQSYVERDGKRVFYEVEPAIVTSSTTVPTLPTETVIFTLPLRTTPLAFTSCIGTDVVAVSPAGVLIRNSDYAKYQGSGEATLIGYTLDGFPLYGRTSSLTTDACGGAMVGGTYRYYLSAERDGVLGCFAGIPVAL